MIRTSHARAYGALFRAIIMLTMVASISNAAADARNITADDFLEMNETYRAGLVHGVLASMFELGVDKQYVEPL
jgi:hypothetical protein